jgi:hypothetical protein
MLIKIIERSGYKKYGCKCGYHYGESCYHWEYISMKEFNKIINNESIKLKEKGCEIIDIIIEENKAFIKYQESKIKEK